MNIQENPNWLRYDIQTHIGHIPIPLTNANEEEERAIHILKVKIRRNQVSSMSKTYKLKMAVFKNDQPEELLGFLNNFNNSIDVNVDATVAGWINYLCTILSR